MGRDTLIEKLRHDVAEGRVVIVAGTGVSVAACHNQDVGGHQVAAWTGLLQHGVQHCKDIGAVDEKAVGLLNAEIASGEIDFLTGAAEKISQRMKKRGPGVFRGWLKDTVGALKVKDDAILKAVAALPGVLATLNYDGLIEAATGRSAVTWLNADKTQEVLRRENENAVLHLHGWFDEPKSVVLGLSSYLTVRDDPHAQAVLNSLTIDRVMLLVGCGDTVLDPNFVRLIEWGKEALKDVAPRHYLLCRTSEIAEFHKKLSDAPWLQPLDYGADYKDLVPFLGTLALSGTFASSPPRQPRGPIFDLDGYRQVLRKRYSRLKLEDLDPTTHDIQPLTLSAMFIAQNARECAEFVPRVFELPKDLQRRLREASSMSDEIDEETLQQHRRAYLEQSPRPIVEIVNDPALPRIVVLGDPGSGKSTLLAYLVLTWVDRAAPDLAREPLPLIIELREYARLRHANEVDGFLGYLHSGASVRWHFDRARLDAWLKSNASLILFDGLDEVFDPALRREISTAIHRFADEYPLARIVVTSRIIGYQHQTWRDEHFRHFMLQELDGAQIADFIARWHRAAFEEASKGEEKRTLLARAIEDSAAIQQLASNPLLLTMMAILNRTQDLPRDRAELYEQCARLLLHQWKVDVAFAPDPELSKASLDFKDKRGLLLRVARTMQSSEHGLAGNLIDEATLESTLAEGLKGIPDLRPERAARALIDQLRGRNFMICSLGVHSYSFVHRTFLEFFCAADIRARFETEQSLSFEELKTGIFGHWREETWHEVLCLLAGMIAPRFLAQILEWLLAQPDPDSSCHHVFLAAGCVGESRKRTELGAAEAMVRDRTKALVQFEFPYSHEPWEDEATIVAAIRTRAVSTVGMVWRGLSETRAWLEACSQSAEDWGVRRSAVETLAREWKDGPETLAWLKGRARSDEDSGVRWSAIQVLARGWKDDPEILPMIKACAQSDEYWRVRRSAIQSLVLAWKHDPETLPIVKARAQSDENLEVRKSAIQELARGWKDDPGTLPIVKARAESDEDSGVRQSAVQVLARGWKDDPETLPWLKAHARSDENWAVRRSAVQQLARGGKDDPETFPIVKARAQSDENSGVRRCAIQELARVWKDNPETLPIVKARAQSDVNWAVRRCAVQELARVWKDNPETLPIIKARARSDDHSVVRRCAVEALARGWKYDPGTLAIIKARAQSDDDSAMRQTAIQELARGGKDDPETLAIIRARAQCDEDSAVRQSAKHELARGWKDDIQVRLFLSDL